ncbi:conserved protein of unknown function (plasmid) [Rhodovastum atsumiense]|uniref:Uncharacterized protein n=1 Tax=Rhodovastum atsumiense TaxID=504468 RepID=A0A5M6ITB5_9PROT|nr:hypothetical protein [Rhodovastum atsumiense]KAA5611556.1 hypothetical protein F1189_13405 [Rhodovastum atsumiense]CAH2606215.1 conserved protein of unknown function [Rhodovastum atsumiense]
MQSYQAATDRLPCLFQVPAEVFHVPAEDRDAILAAFHAAWTGPRPAPVLIAEPDPSDAELRLACAEAQADMLAEQLAIATQRAEAAEAELAEQMGRLSTLLAVEGRRADRVERLLAVARMELETAVRAFWQLADRCRQAGIATDLPREG